MNASPRAHLGTSDSKKLGVAWLGLCLALAVHVFDEASTGFLAVYNPTVVALRQKLGFWPMPTFEFRDWLTGLVVAIIVLLALSPFAFRGARLIRPLFYVLAVLMLLNGIGHTLASIFGRTVSTVHFPRPAPGFYSSPLLLIASIYALWQLRRTA
jgi:hypothetical protein